MATVLLIEDDFFLRSVLQHELESRGHRVVSAPHAKDAEKLQEENAFSVVVTDLIMPERDGFELLTRFRGRFPRVKIIAMSAGGTLGAPQYLRIARQLGADDTLLKPISGEDLEQAIRRALN